MIHIIGTSHSLQVWTDAIRNGASLDTTKEAVEAFERYLAEVARLVKADMIAEEASDEWVANYGHRASSVAKDVAMRLSIQHLFCDPDAGQRESIGLKVGEELHTHVTKISKETGAEWADVHNAELNKQFWTREAFWLQRLVGCDPNKRSVIFVCGADHVDTFKDRLHSKQILAEIHCADWTGGAKE
jgi:hypothetical protein